MLCSSSTGLWQLMVRLAPQMAGIASSCNAGKRADWGCMQAMQAVEGLNTKGDKQAASQQIKALYETFVKSDCTMVEVGTRDLSQHTHASVRTAPVHALTKAACRSRRGNALGLLSMPCHQPCRRVACSRPLVGSKENDGGIANTSGQELCPLTLAR